MRSTRKVSVEECSRQLIRRVRNLSVEYLCQLLRSVRYASKDECSCQRISSARNVSVEYWCQLVSSARKVSVEDYWCQLIRSVRNVRVGGIFLSTCTWRKERVRWRILRSVRNVSVKYLCQRIRSVSRRRSVAVEQRACLSTATYSHIKALCGFPASATCGHLW